MGLGNIHLCTFDYLAIGCKCIILGLPCLLLFLFKAFEAQNFGGLYLSHFLTFLGDLKSYMCVLSCSMLCPLQTKNQY